MMRRAENQFVSFIFKPACIMLLLVGLFGLVWLRSSVVSVSYDLRTLEEEKMESLKDRKMLLADRSNAISLAKIGGSSDGKLSSGNQFASSGYVFPDRVKVVHLKKRTGPEAYKASLEIKGKK
jgi:hypothetical protein